MPEKKRRKFNVCPNCRYQFKGIDNFCPNCGQENHNLNVPFSHVVLEVLEGTLHFDTKVFRTLKLLLFSPGELTRLFAENRRASFVPPVRLYVFISFIFFLVLSADVLNKGKNVNYATSARLDSSKGLVIGAQPRHQSRQGPVAFDIGGLNSEDIKKISALNNKGVDSVLQQYGFAVTDFNRTGIRKVSKYLASSDEEQTHKFLKMLSLLMFLLMPVFGLILKSAYFRNNSRYIQHLVFSVHFHCFVFIVLIITFLLEMLSGFSSIAVFTWALVLAYLFLALRRLYAQSAVRTALKTVYAAGLYAITLAVFSVIALVLSVASA